MLRRLTIWARPTAPAVAPLLLLLAFAPSAPASPPDWLRRLPDARLGEPPGLLDPQLVRVAMALRPAPPAPVAIGAAEARPPLGWTAQDLSGGRQMLVAMAPESDKDLSGAPQEGIWIAWHIYPTPPGYSLQNAQHELATVMPERIRHATSNRPIRTSQRSLLVSGLAALRVDFEPASGPAGDPASELVGWHFLVRTPSGVLEAHASLPRQQHAQRAAEMESVLASLRIVRP